MNIMLKFAGCVVVAGQAHTEWVAAGHLALTAVQYVAARVPQVALA
jgi:hypothetical protein